MTTAPPPLCQAPSAAASVAGAGLVRRPVLGVTPRFLRALESPAGALEFLRSDPRLIAGLRYAQSGLLEVLDAAPEDAQLQAASLTAAKYLLRAAGRPTPYGYFAGTCPARWSEEGWLLPELNALAREARVDHRVLEDTGKQPSFYLNPTATTVGEWLVYYAPGSESGLACPSTLQTVALDPVLRRIIEHGEVDPSDLDELTSAAQVSHGACLASLRRLHQQGVLLPRYAALVADEFGDVERHRLGEVLATAPPDRSPVGEGRPPVSRRPIETTYTETPAQIPGDLRSQLALAASFLDRLMLRSDPLATFRERFLARFDTNMVPLPLVCSREFGLGSDGGLLPGTGLGPSPTIEPHPAVGSLIGEQEVDLRTLGSLLPGEGEGGFDHVMCRLISSSTLLSTTMLGAGTEMVASLARAGVTLPSVAQLVRQKCTLVEQQSQPALVAEVVFLTDADDGNAARRVSTYTYQIPVLGHASVPASRQLPPSSLLLGVRDGRFLLRCNRTGRQVHPRLSTSQNPHHPRVPFLIRLLSLLQWETGGRGVSWSWGQWNLAPRLPRVRVGPIVLSPRTWRPLVAPLTERFGLSDGDLLRWLERHQLPRFALLEAPSQEAMVLDLRSPLCRSMVLAAKRAEGPSTLPVRLSEIDGLEGLEQPAFEVSEAVLEIPRSPARKARSPAKIASPTPCRMARHFPGGEWVYVRIYCGPTTADELIREVLPQLRQRCLGQEPEGSPPALFFVRYSEGGTHLRVRLSAPTKVRGAMLGALLQIPQLPVFGGRIDRIELGTYIPEQDVYGSGEKLEAWHQWCSIDSEFCERVFRRLMSSDWHARLPWAMLWTAHYAWTLGAAHWDLHPRRSGIPTGTQRRIDEELGRARDLLAELFIRRAPAYQQMQRMFRRANESTTVLRSRSSDRLPTLIERGLHLHFNRMMPEVPQGAELGFIWGVRRLLGWMVHTQGHHLTAHDQRRDIP